MGPRGIPGAESTARNARILARAREISPEMPECWLWHYGADTEVVAMGYGCSLGALPCARKTAIVPQGCLRQPLPPERGLSGRDRSVWLACLLRVVGVLLACYPRVDSMIIA